MADKKQTMLYGLLTSIASKITYDNTESGLEATNVQDAIDEVVNRLIYSSDEEIIGKTKDGKNVCRRMFEWNVGTLADSRGFTELAWDFPDYLGIVDVAGTLIYTPSYAPTTKEITIIPMTHPSYALWFLGFANFSSTQLLVNYGTGWASGFTNCVVKATVTYIKED